MKAVFALLLIAAASATSIRHFREWQAINNKIYTASEELRRFEIFKLNLVAIRQLNANSRAAKFGLNKFSDLSNEEFKELYTTTILGQASKPANWVAGPSSNEDIDYSSWLPAVKDQGQCGSCWAFSAVANMEGQTYMKSGEVVSLSEQQLVSCDHLFNMGCNGGNMQFADLYAIMTGMTTTELYPYVSGTGNVPACKSFEAKYKFESNQAWNFLTDDKMQAYVKQYGPLSVAIEADKACFQNYKSGVLTADDCACGSATNHGVTLVGYGTEEGLEYWLVRNSWGLSWGDKGYVKLQRGNDMCAINSQPSSIIA